MSKRPEGNAERCRRYREKQKAMYGIKPITLMVPIHSHEEMKWLAKRLCQPGVTRIR